MSAPSPAGRSAPPGRRGRAEKPHNLIGEDAEEWRDILAQPDLSLHLYGKLEIRPDRKMGHVTRVFPETPNHEWTSSLPALRLDRADGLLIIPPPRLD